MAQKFLSPGVFTTEIDESFLAQGVAGIGSVLVGRSLKGPAFRPTFVGGFNEFVESFGGLNTQMQMPYAAKNYLRNSASLTVVRILGHSDGGTTTNGYIVGNIAGICDSTASNAQVLAVVHASGAFAAVVCSGVVGDASNFVFKVGSIFAATASFLTASANYIGKVLNTDPTLYSTYGHYVYQIFSDAVPAASASWTVQQETGSTSFLSDFANGVGPWVKSQPLGGLEFDLFRFVTLADGRATNDELKVTVANIRPSVAPTSTPFGTFDVIVRDFSDTDARQVIVESFTACSLDPDSDSFIARKIGDSYELFDTTQRKFIGYGTYPSKSKRIRVEMKTGVNSPEEALPWGFRGVSKLPFGNSAAVPQMPYTPNQYDRNGNIDVNICWGTMFVSGGIVDRMRAFPDSSANLLASDADFSLKLLSASYILGKQVYGYNTALAQASWYQPIYASASLQKFTVPFAGGFDGWDLRVADPMYLANSDDESSAIGVVSGKRALDTIANPDAFDMNLLAVPGIHNLKVADRARSIVNDRMDAMFVMDITGSSVAEAIGNLKNREIDDDYTACYYPDLRINDTTNKRVVRVAPSVAVMGTLAFSDRVGQPWFAPAGLTRGGLAQFDIIDVADRLTFVDRDDLYSNRINPIATFPNEGIVVWGQKTLQVAASSLDRVNVRRLLIYAKKTVASAAKFLVFEPNNPATWQRFTNMVNPILENIRQNQGVERFKVVMDSNTNTPDVVDRNVMAGKIFLQPTKSAEFIDLSFVITNAGVAFGD